jgi:ABC-type nitrate/sulfonate/bicarbonate transport system permease component
MMRTPATTALAGVAGVAGALVLWQVVSVTDTLDRTSFPPPTEVADALGDIVAESWFWTALWETAKSTLLGLAISIAIALPLGALLGLNEAAFRSTRLIIEFLKPIPVVALLPLALLLYGATMKMKVVLIVFGTLWPLLMQVVYGVQNVDAVAGETARAYRLRRLRRMSSVVLPSAAPFIATGLRIAGVTALLLSIVTELVGGAAGLGLQITRAQSAAHYAELYALVVVTGLLGIVVNSSLRRLERRTLRWLPEHRDVVA